MTSPRSGSYRRRQSSMRSFLSLVWISTILASSFLMLGVLTQEATEEVITDAAASDTDATASDEPLELLDLTETLEDEAAAAAAAAKPKKPAPPVITETTWVISALTPINLMQAKLGQFEQDHSKVANYVHWTCHRQKPANEYAVLPCCQQIYRAMQTDPASLCWIKNGCAATASASLQKASLSTRSGFLRMCTQQLMELPALEEEPSSLQPRYSLVASPADVASLTVGPWRQFVMVEGAEAGPGNYHYMVNSPVHLGHNPMPPAAESEDQEAAAPPPALPLKLMSKITAGRDRSDENARTLHGKLSLNLGSLEPSLADDSDGFTMNALVLVFLPEGVTTPHTDPAALTCSSACPDAKCTVVWKEGDDMDSSVIRQTLGQAVVTLTGKSGASTDTCEASLQIALHLDDDDFVIPPPVIYQASLTSSGSDGSDTAVVYEWTQKEGQYQSPLTTDLELTWAGEL